MKLTSFNVNGTIVRTKKEKEDILVEKKILKRQWEEDFIDEDTGEVVTIVRKLQDNSYSHPQLNRMLKKHLNAKKI